MAAYASSLQSNLTVGRMFQQDRPRESLARLSLKAKAAGVSSSSELISVNSRRATFSRKERQRCKEGSVAVVCAASGSDELQQMKEMAAAERRWEAQVADGRVKSLSSKEAGYAYELNNHVLLDVRPSYERKKAWVPKSVWIPAFDLLTGWAPGTLLNKFSNFALGGWWSGAPLTKLNERAMPDVVAKIPKSANVIVVCQRGLRSLAACEQLYKAGYRNLFWLQGGFDSTEEGDFAAEGSQPLKFAGIGGVSEFVGWTDVQRAQVAKEGITYRLKLFSRLVLVVVAADLAFVGSQQLFRLLHE